jgi:hypothetical protein
MVLLWLCDVPYRSERVRNQQGAKRVRLTLPRTDFMTRVLEDSNVHIDWGGRITQRSTRLRVRGLLDIAPGSEWRGTLTRWDEEATTMRAYYHDPADAYFVKVRRVFELQQARPCNHLVDPSGYVRVAHMQDPICRPYGFDHAATASDRGFCVTAPAPSACLMGAVDKHPRLLGDAVRGWGFSPDDLDKALMIVVVTPIVDLVLQLRWSTLILRAAWRCQPFPGFPDREWAAMHAASAGVQPVQLEEGSAEVTCTRVDALMDNLRRWAPAILAAATATDGEDATEEKMTLEMTMSSP